MSSQGQLSPQQRKVLLPWVTGCSILLLFDSGSPKGLLVLSEVARLSVPWELGSLFICVCEWGGDKLRCVCVCVCVESDSIYSGAVWMVSAELDWIRSHRLLCLYTKKLFFFLKGTIELFRESSESTDTLTDALKDAHMQTQLHPYACTRVCHLCLIQRWNRRQCLCLFWCISFPSCQVWSWELMAFLEQFSQSSCNFGHSCLLYCMCPEWMWAKLS